MSAGTDQVQLSPSLSLMWILCNLQKLIKSFTIQLDDLTSHSILCSCMSSPALSEFVWVCACRSQRMNCLSSYVVLHLTYETGFLTEPRASYFIQVGCPEIPRHMAVLKNLKYSVVIIGMYSHKPSFCEGIGEPNMS